MEQFNPNTLEGTAINRETRERQDELLRREDNEALRGLEDMWDIDATRNVVASLASNNPLFAENLGSLQNSIWASFISEMRRWTETQSEGSEISSDIVDYFSLDSEEIQKLQESLWEVGLDIFRLLNGLKEYIETQLWKLPEEHKVKIRTSIGRKTGSISEIVEEIKAKNSSPEDFRNKRWILDEKIAGAYNFYTQELFPTLQVKLALARGEQVPETYTRSERIISEFTGEDYGEWNPNYTDIDAYMEEIDELLNADVDDEGNFDEGFFSTQRLLSNENEVHSALFEEMGIQSAENISLLSEEDKQIQAEAMTYYLFAVGVQCLPYIWGVPWVAADATDIFSSQDATMMGLKEMWLVPEEFQMEKTTLDRILAGAGIVLTIVGLQALARSKKLAKAIKNISKIPAEQVSQMLTNFGWKFWLWENSLAGIRRLFWLEDGRNAERAEDGVEAISKISETKFYQRELPWENINEKTDALIEFAENTRWDYDAFTDSLWRDFNAVDVLNSKQVPLKERSKIIDKVMTDYNGDVTKMTDVLRWSIVFDSLDNLRWALDAISHSPDVEKVFIKNRLWPDYLSMSDVLINVKHKNGFVSEVQFHIAETLHAKEYWYILDNDIIKWTDDDYRLIAELKEWEKYGWRKLHPDIQLPENGEPIKWHELYEIRRSIEIPPPTEKLRELLRKIDELDKQLYTYARQQYTLRTWQNF